MAKMLGWKDVLNQSKSVFNQFGESKWIPFAKENAGLQRKNTSELQNIGIGKILLLCAMGESLEANIDIIKKYRDRFDIVTCDKGFVPLLKQGVKADYVVLCDCNILYHHIERHIEDTKDVKLLCTPYANTVWTKMWKGNKYFFINEDALKSENIFLNIFGSDMRIIPAGSNVSNAMLIFFTGSNQEQNVNFSGYQKFLLVGYDYSWRPKGNYYAWFNPIPKRYYMNHRTLRDVNQEIVHTSENLYFSAKWLYTYITVFHLPVINCSDRGILDIPFQDNLENQVMNIDPDKEKIINISEHFETLVHISNSYKNSLRLFEKSKGDRYGYRSRSRDGSKVLCGFMEGN